MLPKRWNCRESLRRRPHRWARAHAKEHGANYRAARALLGKGQRGRKRQVGSEGGEARDATLATTLDRRKLRQKPF